MANLNEVLEQIAAQVKCDGEALKRYAVEDTLGGYHIDPEQRKWEQGSIWEDEGKILYALIRELKPQNVLQIGGWVGCSAAHLALAVADNGSGYVTSVDNAIGKHDQTSAFPVELRKWITFVEANGEDFINQEANNSLDFIFEDADHSTELVTLLTRLSLRKLKPGGLLINHDAAHDIAFIGGGQQIYSSVGKEVRDGLEAGGARYKPYITDTSDCGLAISVKPTLLESLIRPGYVSQQHSVKVVDDNLVTDHEADARPVMDMLSQVILDQSTDPEFKSGMSLEPEKQKRTRRTRNPKTGKLE